MTRRVESHNPSARIRPPAAAPPDGPSPVAPGAPSFTARAPDRLPVASRTSFMRSRRGAGLYPWRPRRARDRLQTGGVVGSDAAAAVGAEDPLDAGVHAGDQVE